MAKIEVELSDGSKAGETLKELGKQANALNKALRDLKPETEEFTKKAADLKVVEERMAKVKKEIKGTDEASKSLKAAFEKFIPFAGVFKSVGDEATGAGKGVGGLVSKFGLVRGAIISTGIGALVVLLGSLISYLTTTQEGIDKVTSVTRPLSAIFEALKGVLQELGGRIFKQLGEAIKEPGKAIRELGDLILENIINRFKAIALVGPALKKIFSGDLSGGFKDLGNAAIQAVSGVTNAIDKIQDAGRAIGAVMDEAWEKGKKLDDLQKAIEKQEISQVVRLKQLELGLKQQKDIIEDASKSWDERRSAAQQALNLEQAMMGEELSLLDKRIEKMKIDQSLNDTSREQQKELAELEAKKLEVQAKVVEQSIEFKKKIQEFDKAQADEAKRLEDERLKALEEQRKEFADAVKDLDDKTISIMQEGRDKDLAQVNLNLKRQVEAIDANAPLYAERVAAAEELAQQQRDAIAQKYREKEIADKISANELDLAEDQNALNERLLARQITEQQYIDMTAQNAVAHKQQELDLLKEAHGQESAEYQRAYGELLAMQQAQSDAAVEITKKETEQKIAAVTGSLGVFGNFFGALASMQEKGSKQAKKFAVAQAIMSTLQSTINAFQSTVQIPFVGSILAPIAAAAAFAFGMQNVNKIRNTPDEAPTKAARGMVLRGPSHVEGGIPIEAEGDEIILTKGVYRNPTLRQMASNLNVAGGGIRFAAGGPVSPFPSTSAVTSVSPAAAVSTDSISSLSMKMDELIAAQDRRIDRIKVINVATETQEEFTKVDNIRAEADV